MGKLTTIVYVGGACTASASITHVEGPPKLILTVRPDWVLLTTSYSAAAGFALTDHIVKPDVPAEPPPTPNPPPTTARITSFGFEVETLTLDDSDAEIPTALAGCARLGSKGLVVFAPETPYAIIEKLCIPSALGVAVRVMVSFERGEEATAHHSPTPSSVPRDGQYVSLVWKVKPLAVGVPKLN